MPRRRTPASGTGSRNRGLVATVAIGSIAAVALGIAALAMHRSADDLIDERESLEAAEAVARFQGVVDELAARLADAGVPLVAVADLPAETLPDRA